MKKIVKDIVKLVCYPVLGSIYAFLDGKKELENKVVFSSFWGQQYGDSPRSISEKLHEMYPDIRQAWIYRGNPLDIPEYAEVIPWTIRNVQKNLHTSKVWVDSHTKPTYVKKRRGQFYIETWHGGISFKKLEADIIKQSSITTIPQIKHNSKMVDVYISNSSWYTQLYRKSFFYKGNIAEIGFPKSDIFFQREKLKEIADKTRKELCISTDEKIILYAPTFRMDHSLEYYKYDFKQILDIINQKWPGNWKLLIKLHPLMRKKSWDLFAYNSEIINVSEYVNMQGLTIAADIFITDYSSGIFDFALTGKPAFILANDLERYMNEERGFYIEPNKTPFPFSANLNEFSQQVSKFDQNSYQKELNDFFDKLGLRRNGNSAEIICNWINKVICGGVYEFEDND